MKRLICCSLAFFLALTVLPAFAQEFAEIPDILRISITQNEVLQPNGIKAEIDEITTANPHANAQLALMLKRLREKWMPNAEQTNLRLKLTITYRITGTKWASFMATARVSDERATKSIDFECQSYDMTTGEALTLGQLLNPEADGMAVLIEALRESLEGVYPKMTRDTGAIEAMLLPEAIAKMPFMLGTGQLTLPVLMNDFLQDKPQILNTIVYYDQLGGRLTDEATAQTDNLCYRILALTFDDGPTGWPTRRVLRSLSEHGANATFFLIGDQFEHYSEYVRREADAGHLLGAHTMRHKYSNEIDEAYMRKDKLEFLSTLEQATGLTTKVFRAPGGRYQAYLHREIGWINFHWSYSAGDTGSATAEALAARVANAAGNGAIALMHDRVHQTAEASAIFLDRLREKNFLFASVEELLRMNGYQLEINQSYRNADGPMENANE